MANEIITIERLTLYKLLHDSKLAYTTNSEIDALFTASTYTVTVSASPTVGGTVSGGGLYYYHASATLIATPNDGYSFVQWSDGNTSATRVVTVNNNITLTAQFAEDTTTFYILGDRFYSDSTRTNEILPSFVYYCPYTSSCSDFKAQLEFGTYEIAEDPSSTNFTYLTRYVSNNGSYMDLEDGEYTETITNTLSYVSSGTQQTFLSSTCDNYGFALHITIEGGPFTCSDSSLQLALSFISNDTFPVYGRSYILDDHWAGAHTSATSTTIETNSSFDRIIAENGGTAFTYEVYIPLSNLISDIASTTEGYVTYLGLKNIISSASEQYYPNALFKLYARQDS